MNTDLASASEQNNVEPQLRNVPSTKATLDYVHRATAENTRQAYRSDIRHFQHWGGRLPTDVATVVKYCEEHAQSLNPRTLKRRLVAIKQFHHYQGFPDPTGHPLVTKTVRGIFNVHGTPKNQAPPILLEHIQALLKYLDTLETLAARRDAAMISLGFFAALRGSELVGTEVSHITVEPKGLTLTIPRSKTDPRGEGQSCSVPRLDATYCPVTLLDRWQAKSGIKTGHLFPSINRWQQCAAQPITLQGLNQMLKHWALVVGLAQADKVSSHSLRRGFATSASAAGASFKSIMNQGRWHNEGTVLEYIEAGQKFNDNAVSKLFEKS